MTIFKNILRTLFIIGSLSALNFYTFVMADHRMLIPLCGITLILLIQNGKLYTKLGKRGRRTVIATGIIYFICHAITSENFEPKSFEWSCSSAIGFTGMLLLIISLATAALESFLPKKKAPDPS